ncbi:leucine-rich repeat transmembrane neuronal protein 1-like [Helicoverpa zea]|uniref:leucine-rich repeat transmembrane neuronal protein 1-like n=1 Tax=Helicoverpa zea TaxID=7113 RepID=UPI001F59B64D|nr:leucine-rich repeat transmembrane neuronal protein 1-like [Helicoverpa zea]
MFRIYEIFFVMALSCVCTQSKEMTEIEALGAQPRHCTYEYAYEMYGAHCAGRGLNKIPNLKSGIEILDFSDNKLQELTEEMMSGYTSIKFLYLADNHIYNIEETALSRFTNLQTLDLSNNVILELPNSIFQLPSLRKLYFRSNPIFHKAIEPLVIERPIKAPLELLDVSDCKIKNLPDWGYLPQLRFYNISHNPLAALSVDHFARMCNLVNVDLTDSIGTIKLCSMRPAVLWLKEKRVSFLLADYSRLNTREFENCPVPDDMVNYNATYHRCKADYLQVQSSKASRRTWLTIGGGLAGFLVGFILLLYVMHRHNVAQTKTKAEKIKQATPPDSDKNATAVLLGDIS